MRLNLLVNDLPDASVHGSADVEISSVASRHDAVSPGAIFVAVRGFTHDGHAFVPQAVARGAVAVVTERPVDVPSAVARVHVPDSRLGLALISSAFYGHPSRQLNVIGVTGTNGKGTTAYLVEAMLTAAGKRCGIIGTMGVKMEDHTVGLDRTTPEALDLQRLLRQMVDEGTQYALVEVASHALVLHRVAGMRFAGAVFTNLTQDHLDFHKTLDEYRAAKRRLFEMVEPTGIAVVNGDDPSGKVMAEASRAPVTTYGIDHRADVRASGIRLRLDGMDYSVRTSRGTVNVASRLQGRFNVYNSLAAMAVALAEGVSLKTIQRVLSEFAGVPGRFEAVNMGQQFGVVVDYAHTPDGLENVLRTAKDFVRGRTIVVFGAGGDRDRTKRPKMGAIVSALADVVIVTSDNPRTEQPTAIIQEILAGITDRSRPLEVEADRRKAIFRAIEIAEPGDFVIIAGKGHEPYQEIAGVKHPFDDRLVAKEALAARAAHA